MNYQVVGKLDDFPDGRAVEVRIGARRIAVYRTGEQFHALKNICPHQGDLLHRVPPSEGQAVCIGHGWRFDLTTGVCVKGDVGARVAVYPVRVEGETVMVGVG